MKCRICNNGKDYKGLGAHLGQTHGLSQEQQKDYYDKYIKREGEGICLECGKPTKYLGLRNGYRQFCSITCSNLSPFTKEKRIKNSLKKYGTEHPSQSPEVKRKQEETNLKKYGSKHLVTTEHFRKKTKETSMEKYGVPHPSQAEEVKEKMKETNLERYGVVAPIQNEDIKSKITQTNLEKYGVENPFQSEEIRDKIKQTNLERFGVENPVQSEEVQLKIMQTNLERYGSEHIGGSKEIQERIKKTNLERYGFPYALQSSEVREKATESNMEKYGVKHVSQRHIRNYDDYIDLSNFLDNHKQEFNSFELADYFNIGVKSLRGIIVSLGKTDFVRDFYTLSLEEYSFIEKLDNLNIDYVMHDRSRIAPLELDIYIPEYNLAVEISPTWTHKYITDTQYRDGWYGKPGKDYHYNKFKLCRDVGIDLITLFEWMNEDQIVNMIASRNNQNVNSHTIKTELVKDIDFKSLSVYADTIDVLKDSNEHLGSRDEKLIFSISDSGRIIGSAVSYIEKSVLVIEQLRLTPSYHDYSSLREILKSCLSAVEGVCCLSLVTDNSYGTYSIYKKLGFEILEEIEPKVTYHNYNKNITVVNSGSITENELKNLNQYGIRTRDDLHPDSNSLQNHGFYPVYDCGYTRWLISVENL